MDVALSSLTPRKRECRWKSVPMYHGVERCRLKHRRRVKHFALARPFDVCGFNTFSTSTLCGESPSGPRERFGWPRPMRGVQMTGITHDTILIRSGMMIDSTELYRSVELINTDRDRKGRGRDWCTLNRYFRIRTSIAMLYFGNRRKNTLHYQIQILLHILQ